MNLYECPANSILSTESHIIIERDYNDIELWDKYVGLHPCSLNYHRYKWRNVIENSFGHACYYLAAKSANGDIVGILPLVFMQSKLFGSFLVSLPFLNYGGLLFDSIEIAVALLKEARLLQQELGAEHIELRHIDPLGIDIPTKQHKVTMILDLADGVDNQWQRFNPKLRNQIRKAEKNDLTPIVGGRELLDDFYSVFVRNMRDLGTPVYSKKIFSSVLDTFPECTRIISVYLKGKPIASGLVNYFRSSIEIPWASSIREYNPLCPNNLLYWTAIQFALGKGLKKFDFGRSTPGEGTYKFKEQWGAKPLLLHWQYLLPEGAVLPELNPKNPKFEMAIRIWQKLPLPVTRILGPQIVKYIP